ncbi:DUF4181 domain-containing protein [Oceanobacillus sp. J11TS1]|uniref:DUF4181 domain-containing protein n=1 Tax=Oceanobacillus sp. J11TS1 TaxID=2807191 RepID=UPI001BB4413D|nr:DUF4181 domain-containing protein [Oceanobacillus sp. J11TS1]
MGSDNLFSFPLFYSVAFLKYQEINNGVIFIGMAVMFAFRTIMKWTFARENKTYLLSAVTCGLFIIGSVVYGLL